MEKLFGYCLFNIKIQSSVDAEKLGACLKPCAKLPKIYLMKIKIAQINTTAGDIKGNTAKIIAYLKKAEKNGAELAIFPKAAITGWPLLNLAENKNFIDAALKELNKIVKTANKTACLINYIGHGGLNYIALIHNKKIISNQILEGGAQIRFKGFDIAVLQDLPLCHCEPCSLGRSNLSVRLKHTARLLRANDALAMTQGNTPAMTPSLSCPKVVVGHPEKIRKNSYLNWIPDYDIRE